LTIYCLTNWLQARQGPNRMWPNARPTRVSILDRRELLTQVQQLRMSYEALTRNIRVQAYWCNQLVLTAHEVGSCFAVTDS
jgi:hypothetical protein